MAKTVKKKTIKEHINEEFEWNNTNINILFLGIGLVMFVLNVTTIITFIPFIDKYDLPLAGFYTSLLSSLFLIGYATYNIYGNK